MGTLAAFATFGVGFLSDRSAVSFSVTLVTGWDVSAVNADRLDDGHRDSLDWYSSSFSTIGWWAPILLVTLRAIQDLPSAANGEAQRCFPLKVRRK